MTIFIRQRDPRLRTDGVFVPDSWFQRFGDDTASVMKDYRGVHVTTYADLGRRKRELQAARLERLREPEFRVLPLHVWVFHCPGPFFMGWWTYLVGRGVSEGKHMRRSCMIDRIMELFPCGDRRLFPLSQEEWMPLFARRYALRHASGRARLHAGRIQGKAPVWAALRGASVVKIARDRASLSE